MDVNKIKRLLILISKELIYVTRGKEFSMVEARFRTIERDHKHSVSLLKSSEVDAMLEITALLFKR